MYLIKEDIAITQQDPNTVLMISVLDSENCYFKLDGIGAQVFLQLKDGKGLQEIKDTLLETYDVDSQILDQDIDKLITYLLENKIIEKK